MKSKYIEWLKTNCKNNDAKLNKLLAPEIEARYKLTNKILDDLNIKQVVEIELGEEVWNEILQQVNGDNGIQVNL